MDIFLELLGIILIFVATEINRNEESKIKFFSLDWFVQIILVVIAVNLIINSELAQHALK